MQKLRYLLVVILLVVLGYLLFKKQASSPQLPEESTPPDVTSGPTISPQIQGLMREIPQNAQKITLKDVSGGTASGIGAKSTENNLTTITIISDLPQLATKTVYEAWLEKQDPTQRLLLGVLNEAKGGWLLDYQSTQSLQEFKNVLVSEEKTLDQIPEKIILKGTF